MQNTFQEEILHGLAGRFKALEIEYALSRSDAEDGAMPYLRALFSSTGDGEGQIAMDILFYPGYPNLQMMQLYSTIATKIAAKAEPELLRLFNTYNFYSPLGAFGIYTEAGHVYHKYSMPVYPELPIDVNISALEETIAYILTMIGPRYQLIHAMASGLLTYAEAEKKGLVNGPVEDAD